MQILKTRDVLELYLGFGSLFCEPNFCICSCFFSFDVLRGLITKNLLVCISFKIISKVFQTFYT